MRRSILLPVFLVGLLSSPAIAQSEETEEPKLKISGGATLASQYRFRGISLSDEKAALQGTINLSHQSGFYAGVWGSSLDGFGELGGSNLEADFYAGYRRQIADGIVIDAGLLYYAYPGSRGGDFEFFEPYANVSATLMSTPISAPPRPPRAARPRTLSTPRSSRR